MCLTYKCVMETTTTPTPCHISYMDYCQFFLIVDFRIHGHMCNVHTYVKVINHDAICSSDITFKSKHHVIELVPYVFQGNFISKVNIILDNRIIPIIVDINNLIVTINGGNVFEFETDLIDERNLNCELQLFLPRSCKRESDYQDLISAYEEEFN